MKYYNLKSSVYTYDSNGALSLERDAITGRVQARYTNDANGKMIQATSYTYTDESNASRTRIITDTVTTERKLHDNGYVTEETTSEVSFLTVNGMTLVRPFTVEDVTVDYVYDYTSEESKIPR